MTACSRLRLTKKTKTRRRNRLRSPKSKKGTFSLRSAPTLRQKAMLRLTSVMNSRQSMIPHTTLCSRLPPSREHQSSKKEISPKPSCNPFRQTPCSSIRVPSKQIFSNGAQSQQTAQFLKVTSACRSLSKNSVSRR